MDDRGFVREFEQLKTWRAARRLRYTVFRLTRQRVVDQDRGLRSQVRNAALSAMANVAEGFEKAGNAEMLQFLRVAKGSAGELRSHAYAALDSEMLTTAGFEHLRGACLDTSRLIAGFIRYLKATELKGSRHAPPTRKAVREVRLGHKAYEVNGATMRCLTRMTGCASHSMPTYEPGARALNSVP